MNIDAQFTLNFKLAAPAAVYDVALSIVDTAVTQRGDMNSKVFPATLPEGADPAIRRATITVVGNSREALENFFGEADRALSFIGAEVT